ncbi:MAG: hypothetical protein HYY28_03865 [Betaproteobacteria bacterium]|nr:hypothetical protein [Betaproteobacteria bacterium]
MSISGRILLAGVAIAFASFLSGCGERSQVVVYKSGKYQGKTDTKPWDNDPQSAPYTTSKWTRGDKTSWEVAIKARNQNQNEYQRAQ